MLPSIRNSASENLLQAHQDLFRRKRAFETLEHLPIPSDQEFREIPCDILLAFRSMVLCLQKFVESACPLPIDIDLGKDRKRDVVIRFDEFQDFSVAAWLLTTELIAWKSQNRESLVLLFFVEGTQTCVLRCQSSTAGNVHHQADLALEIGKCDPFTGNQDRFKIMHAGHRSFLHSKLLNQSPRREAPSTEIRPSR